MEWNTWSLEDWNSAIIQKVFFSDESERSSIKRIDANARFLVSCTNDKSANPEEVKKCFLMSFGVSARKIRELYKWSLTKNTENSENFPKIFASLYLTLMAGSADDSTQEFGRFRTRFKELLSPYVKNSESLLSIEFSDLPMMWNHVANWSKKRHSTIGDCKELILPSVHSYENRIGLSKRIAFPTYKDEISLKQLLENRQLSENSEFTDVIKAVRYRIKNFSNEFIAEFENFASCVRSQDFDAAYESRFWGIVQDLSLESELANLTSKNKFCLQLDISDPYDPTPYLFFDELGQKAISSCLGNLKVQRRDGLSFVGFNDLAYPNLQQIADSLKIADASKSKVGQILNTGWVILFPDQFGNFSTNGNYSNDGPVCFLVRNKFLIALQQNLEHLGVQFSSIGTGSSTDGWSGYSCKKISRKSLRNILSIAPNTLTRYLRLGWAPSRIQMNGGAWQGQTLLLNPASNPIAKLEGAISGTFKLLNSDGEKITEELNLIYKEEGFQANPLDLQDTKNATYCEYALKNSHGTVKNLRIYLTQSLTNISPRNLKNIESWLCEGSLGTLQQLSSSGFEHKSEQNTETKFAADNLRPTASEDTANTLEVYPSKDINFSTILMWIADALLLRFDTRESLPFKLLMEHIEGAAFLANITPKQLRRLLIDGHWVTPLHHKGAPWPNVVAAPRLAFTKQVGNQFITRISGMLTKTNIYAVKKLLTNEESIIENKENSASIKCLEVQLTSIHRTKEIIRLLNAKEVSQDDFPNPISALNPKLSKMVNYAPPYQSHNMHKWSYESYSWETLGDSGNEWLVGHIRKLSIESNRKNLYWVQISKNEFIRTDSLSWASLTGEVAAKRPILRMQQDGAIVWSEFLIGLPIPLTRWWILFEGGSVSLSSKYQTLFKNGSSESFLKVIGIESNSKEKSNPDRYRNEHRKLALQKYLEKKKTRLQFI